MQNGEKQEADRRQQETGSNKQEAKSTKQKSQCRKQQAESELEAKHQQPNQEKRKTAECKKQKAATGTREGSNKQKPKDRTVKNTQQFPLKKQFLKIPQKIGFPHNMVT